jgi:hypothetical protein
MKTITIDGVEYNLTPIEKQSNPIILKQTLEFEVYPEDLGEHKWEDAKKVCADLGDGWRLPTKEELNLMWLNRESIGGFAAAYYWSSSEDFNDNAWRQYFSSGTQYSVSKGATYYVRAVRDVMSLK